MPTKDPARRGSDLGVCSSLHEVQHARQNDLLGKIRNIITLHPLVSPIV